MKKIIIVLVALLLLTPVFTKAWFEVSDGSRVGIVYKLSYKGLFFKGWEGQLLLGDDKAAYNVDANTWNFSLDRKHKRGENIEELSKQLQSAMESGKRVRVFYKEEGLVAPWRADTTYFVQKIEILN